MNTKIVVPKEFDVSIYPASSLLTTNGVQYNTVVTNSTTTYANLFDIDTDTYFPSIVGELAWVYVNISFEVLGGATPPIVTYKLEADNKGLDTWTIMSGQETYTTTTGYVGKRLEGYLKLTTDLVDTAPLSLRVQFKSNGTGAANMVSIKLKNDSVIRIVGMHKLP